MGQAHQDEGGEGRRWANLLTRRRSALLWGPIAHSSQPHAALSRTAVDLVVLSDSWSRTHAWCTIWTAKASPTFRYECETGPAWWARWSSPA